MIEAVHLKKDNRSYISTGNDACVLSEITHIEIKDFFIRIPEIRLNWLLKKMHDRKVSLYVNNKYYNYGENYAIFLENYFFRYNKEKLISELSDMIKAILEKDIGDYVFIKEYLGELYE